MSVLHGLNANLWRLAPLAVVIVFSLAARAPAEPIDQQAAQAQRLFDEGKFAEALSGFESAREQVKATDTATAAKLDFNRACTHMALKQVDQAEKLLREIDARSDSPRELRAAARYNLGHIEAARADELAKTEVPKAIEALRSAERFFRNALTETPGDADTIRNIELVQRRRAELMKQEQQKKQQEQKQDPKKDQQKQDQQKKDEQDKDQKSKDQKDQSKDQQQQQDQQQKDGQKQGPDQQSAGKNQQKQQQQGQDQQQSPEQEPSDQASDKSQQQQPAADKKPQDKQAKDGKEQSQPEAKPEEQGKQEGDKKDGKEQHAQAAQEAQEQNGEKNGRAFDVAAAQILDKERLKREQIRRMFQQMMRSRAAKVDKDW